MKIFYKKEIEEALDIQTVLNRIEEGFIIYSKKEAVIPPVASLYFDAPPGDCHIKYGYSKKGKYYIIKIASGFPDNPKMGLPVGNGLMLLFDKATGRPVALLLDERYLTDLRTAAAGSIAAKYLAPKNIKSIGIVGTGIQATFQLQLLQYATPCRKVIVWGRNREKAELFSKKPELSEFDIEVVDDLEQLTSQCNLIVTTTNSSKALLLSDKIQPGTHITAVGTDDESKQELDPYIFGKADRIIVDSHSQCSLFGDTSYALKAGIITEDQIYELGEVILDPSLRRTSENQITIADLTGVAIQDLQIAVAAYEALLENGF